MRRSTKRGKKATGGAGGQLPAASDVEKHGAAETTTDGKGQELVVAGRGLARGGGRRALTALEFQGLAAVPAEAEWFANIDNPRTRRAYQIDIHGSWGLGGPRSSAVRSSPQTVELAKSTAGKGRPKKG